MAKLTILLLTIISSCFLNARHVTCFNNAVYNSQQQDSLHIINRHPRLGIVAGKLIGNIKINDSMEEVIKLLGQPDDGDAAMGKTTAFWYTNHDKNNNKLAVYATTNPNVVNGKPTVKAILITSPSFVTKQSIHVGSSYKTISKFYQLIKKGSNIYSSDNGISFKFNSQKKCNAILIHSRDYDVSTIYLNL